MTTIIYHDIEQSTYIFEYDNLKFHFSSRLYLDKFKDRYSNYIKEETDKFSSRFKMSIYADELFLLELYRKIEKRGFKVYYKNIDIKETCSISCIVDLEQSKKLGE